MDNNHTPSSPLHQRRTSSRPSSSHQQSPSNVVIMPPAPDSGRLDPSIPRPGITSPSDASGSLPPFRLDSTMNANQQHHQVEIQMQVDDTSGSTQTVSVEWSSSAMTWDQPQPGESSHQLPTTLPPSPEPHNAEPSCSTSSFPTSASSSLLTSQPLNRCTTSIFENDISASPRKRPRAASLPTPEPIFKRFRTGSPIPTPSEVWPRTLVPRRRERTRLEHHVAMANRFGRRLFKRRRREREEYLSAAKQPPINLTSLRFLDANEILKNPQLRHDLLFDTLAFRPVNSVIHPNAGYAEVFTGGNSSAARNPVLGPEATTAIAVMYWDSVENEIKNGCRCTRWRMPSERSAVSLSGQGTKSGSVSARSANSLEARERVKACVCGGWMSEMSEADWCASTSAWPSRLPEMVKTLRGILTSLMGSTTPCPSHFAHSFSREALEAHERICPTVTHALFPQLCSALDPDFITAQVRRGVFDFRRMFEVLGEAMKVHCAPVRDCMVDGMIRAARVGDVCLALRRCFDCAEVMKLDIANHQVHALRPYLWSTSNEYEYAAFETTLHVQSLTINTSLTRQWIRAASHRVLSASSPQERLRLIGKGKTQTPCLERGNEELAFRSLAEGFMELVFAPEWSAGSAVWPPIPLRRLESQVGVVDLEKVANGNAVVIPEVFKMDIRRIKNFHADMVDIAISFIVLITTKNILARDRPHSASTPLTPDRVSSLLNIAHADLEQFQLAGPITAPWILADLSLRLATRIHESGCKSSFVLPHTPPSPRQFLTCDCVDNKPATSLITPSTSTDASTPSWSPSQLSGVEQTASTILHILHSSLRPDSRMFVSMMRSLRGVLSLILTNTLLGYRMEEDSPFFAPLMSGGVASTASSVGLSGVVQGPRDRDEVDQQEQLENDMVSKHEAAGSVPATIKPTTGIAGSASQVHAAFLRRAYEAEETLLATLGLGPTLIAPTTSSHTSVHSSLGSPYTEYQERISKNRTYTPFSTQSRPISTIALPPTTFDPLSTTIASTYPTNTMDPSNKSRSRAVTYTETPPQPLHIHREVRELVGRMSKIVSFNLGVFLEVYTAKGVCVGS